MTTQRQVFCFYHYTAVNRYNQLEIQAAF